MMGRDKRGKAAAAAAPGGAARADAPPPAAAGLPPHLELQRTRVVCGADINLNTSSTIAANQYMAHGVDAAFDLGALKRSLRVDVTRYEGAEMEFDLRGASCAVANALRRAMIAEVPTMAVEHVFVVDNSSVIQDEVLAHRLGLVPLAADPRRFAYRAAGDAPSEANTLVFRLDVACRRLADGSVEGDRVYSRDLVWLPAGSELPDETGARFGAPQDAALGARPVHGDILLAKLRPGQAIRLEAHAVKGVGEDHAKWSPVATAWYRLRPELVVADQVRGRLAAELAAELPGLVTLRGDGDAAAAVADDARRHEQLLEKARRLSGEPKWEGLLTLLKAKDHFLFTVESTGAWQPHEIFQHAVQLLASKCDKVLEGLQRFPPEGGGGGASG